MLGIERMLEQYDRENDASLHAQYRVLYAGLRDEVYPFSLRLWPEGNDHGWGHIERVLEYLDRLVGSDALSMLSVHELFLAMIAVLYHDIGMLQGREGHAAASHRIIEGMLGDRYIPDSSLREIASLAARCHSSTEDIDANFAPYTTEMNFRGDVVRPRLVAALLRFADELDEDYRRAPEAARAISQLSESPYWHFCSVITGIAPKVRARGREIEIDTQLKTTDLFLAFGNKKPLSFLRFFAEKLAKLNSERQRCNQFLPEPLKVERIQVRYRGFADVSGYEKPTIATLADGASSETVLAPLSGVIAALAASRSHEAKDLLAEKHYTEAYASFHAIYRASEGFPEAIKRERLRSLYNMACACSLMSELAEADSDEWATLGLNWLKQWLREGLNGGWNAAGDSANERIASLSIDKDLKAIRSRFQKKIEGVLPVSLLPVFTGKRTPLGSGGGGGGGGGCLAFGTLIRCPRGDKRIEELAVGEEVLSYDPNRLMIITTHLVSISSYEEVPCIVINNSWAATSDQRIFVRDGEWMRIMDLKLGMRIHSVDSLEPTVIDSIANGPATRVFEFRTDHTSHNVIASGAVFHNVKQKK